MTPFSAGVASPFYVARDQHHLYLAPGTPLPCVCLGCGQRAELVDRDITYVPSWVPIVGLLVNSVFGLIVYFATRQTRRLRMPLCGSCARRMRRRDRFLPLSYIGAVALLVALLVPAFLLIRAPEDAQIMMTVAPLLMTVCGLGAYALPNFGLASRVSGLRMVEPPAVYSLAYAYGQAPVEVLKLAGVHPAALHAACQAGVFR